MKLQIASRKKVKLRMSISSPTGFGKTYSALLLAHGITNDWSKIAVIDTENESASLYSDLGQYYTLPIAPPYTPEKYSEAIKACEDAGIEVIIIDSVTHVWSGQGGLLEYNSSLGGRYQDWAKTTPRYQKWLDSILQSKCHVITTIRKKQAYEMTKENNKIVVEKKGMEDQVRDGYDYEMTIALEIINDKHLAKASKDRTRLFDSVPEFIITRETGARIKEWCDAGITETPATLGQAEYAINILRASQSLDELKSSWTLIGKEAQENSSVIEAKDEMKAKLTPAQV